MEEKKEKLPYEKAEMQIIELQSEQILATSGFGGDENTSEGGSSDPGNIPGL